MRAWIPVLIVALALVAPPVSYGRGGGNHSRAGRASGFSGGFGNSSGSFNQSAPVRSSTAQSGSSKSHSTKSSQSTNGLNDGAFSPLLAPAGSQASRGSLGPLVIPSKTSNASTSNSATTQLPTQSSTTTNGNQTSPNSLQFVNGFPFPVGLGLGMGMSMDSESTATRQYGPLVTNARNLIRAGVYPQAVALLQRVINSVPGTRVAAKAQRLLASVPVL
jgi:hypothetical protein